ncbi:hypothetical protein [Rhizobium sp. Leaf386]|uniref:hypothetical protein n=1 Tax=Rhizobium sp. Leaf386 TaxID=1736359 RepID=UPI000712B233|nr:hypothetical protein [Rhizobium sp. Leaf386]KQS90299.1 hypothetical protein ASG50_07530 [Rhizobium sp. Leaf386]
MRDLQFDIRGRDKSGPAFDSATARARAFDGAIQATARGFAVLETAAKGFVAGLAIGALENFGSIMRQTLTEAADLVDLADKVGVATEELQRLQYGFELAGVPAEDIDQVLTQWAKRIGEAHTQGGKLADLLQANGVSLTDGEGALRSSVDLLRDFAELVANAASDQERTVLATQAFGKAGAAMVLALRDGADGMDELMRAADEAGGVMEDELLRSAAEIDDEFNRMWRQFEISAKSAILQVAVGLSDLRSVFADLNAERQAAVRAAEIGAQLGAMAGKMPEPRKGDRLPSPIDNRIDRAFNNDTLSDPLKESNDRLQQSLLDNRRRYRADYLDRTGGHTIIADPDDDKPKGGRGGGSSRKADSRKDEEEAYDRIIRKLKEEQELLGLGETAQRVLTEQRRAGVEATSEQGRAIEALVTKIEDERRSIEAMEDAADFMQDSIRDSFMELVPEIETGNRALDGFINRMIQAAAEAALFGSGPLGGLFGGGLGGLFGLGGGIGFRAQGGGVEPWSDYVVGEEGPEILRMGGRGGTVIPVEGGAGQDGAPLILTGDIRVFVDDNDKLDAKIERIAVQKSSQTVEAGLTRYNEGMPGRIADIMERNG